MLTVQPQFYKHTVVRSAFGVGSILLLYSISKKLVSDNNSMQRR